MIISKSEFTAHFETDLTQDAIDQLIEDAESEIERRIGSVTAYVEDFEASDGGRELYLNRPASEITTVVETVGDTETTLSSDDYELRHGGREIRRLSDGTNGRTDWGDRIRVTYVPVTDLKRRKVVIIDLVKLAIQFNGLKSEKAGNWSAQFAEYQKTREEIISRLAPPLGVLA